jgi:RNA polymerase primary sigma factor
MRKILVTTKITDRDSSVIDVYLKDIAHTEPLSADQEVILINRIKRGDDDALEVFVTANLRFVVSVAKQYMFRGVPLADLIQEGNIGLINAVHKFDPERGFKFISMAVWWIRQAILQAIGTKSRIIRLPMNQVAIATKIAIKTNELEQELFRKPSMEELADEIGISFEAIDIVMQGTMNHASYHDISPSEDVEMIETIEGDVLIREPQSDLEFDMRQALSSLTEQERDVLRLLFGIGCRQYSANEICNALDCTKFKVYQIRDEAINKLKGNEVLKRHVYDR